jgi:AraC family transcriptional regulator, transcriptional activator FtrA
VLTSAGSAAGIDLCLHLVRRDHGSVVANTVARRMVSPPHRDGGQAQFVRAAVPAGNAGDDGHDGVVARAMAEVIAHLASPWTVERLARQVGVSPRSFARHFRDATGTSPIRWVNAARVRASLPWLEESDVGVEEVAARVGMDAVTYRRHFRAQTATSPSAYRRAFRGREAEQPGNAP